MLTIRLLVHLAHAAEVDVAEVPAFVAEHRRNKHKILRIYVPVASVGAAAVAVGGGLWILADLQAWCPDMCPEDRPRVDQARFTTGAVIETVGVGLIVGSSLYGVPAFISEHYRYKRALDAADPSALKLSVGPSGIALSGTF